LPELNLKSSTSFIRSLIGCAIVAGSAVFFLLALREGNPGPQQRAIDSILHNGLAMGAVAGALLCVCQGWLGPVPRFLQPFAKLLLLTFLLFSGLGLVAWLPLWEVLKPFHFSRPKAQALAAFSMIAVWFSSCAWLLMRPFIRWIGKRYEHHGVAVGFGPLYFYFKRRRAS
jgi:hypothetical protein